jgi:predicted Zn-dependent protease
MTQIPLRAYHHEIEKRLETGRYDEAIKHALYILKSYPKYIDVYRLLGQAYLESGRQAEAADIFLRLLSSVTDDRIANIGLSVIREEQGYIDQAIWHMERALEVEPANPTLQAELRRLYGRRDGTEPLKIPLSRGALARMYLQGNLPNQAIAELRAALQEKPGDLHFQVLLAKILANAGQEAESTQLSRLVVAKLPFCLEANQILYKYLSNGRQNREADIQRGRLVLLDPYYAFTQAHNPSAESVPDEAIILEFLV